MPRTIRTSILANVLTLLFGVGVAITGSMVLGSRTIVRQLSGEVIGQALLHSETRLRAFFEPVTDRLGEIRRSAARGLVDVDDPLAMTRLFSPMLAEMEQVSSLMLADDRGHEIMVLETEAGWRTRHTVPGEWIEYNWQDDPAEATPRSIKDLGYDPRSRPWYIGAVDPGKDGEEGPSLASLRVWWTTPYTFFTTRDPGITAALAFDGADGSSLVAGLDVLLNDISSFTTDLTVGTGGMVIVVDDTGRVIGLPRAAKFASAEERRTALLRRPSELGVQAVTDAVLAFTPELTSDPEATLRPSVVAQRVRFSSDGEAWWGEVRPFQLAHDQQLWISVIMPERDLLGRFFVLRLVVLGLVVLAVLIAIAQTFALARRLSAPIEAIVRENDRIGAGDLEPGEPIATSLREVQLLAEAQDRMRGSLRTLVRVERDLEVARQIQQGTFPKVLPTLPGYDLYGLTRPADETGGDTYDIFGYRGSGAERTIISSGDAEGAMLVLADATGHGVGPAIAATQLRAMIRVAGVLTAFADFPSTCAVLNEQLCADLPEDRFITAWIGLLDSARHELSTFSAGQAPLLHLASDGSDPRWLDADAPPFGIVAGLVYEPPSIIALAPGDLFVVLSDGFYEEPTPDGEQFGRDRVVAILRAQLGRSGREIVAALLDAVEQHTRGAAPKDDRTAVIVRRSH